VREIDVDNRQVLSIKQNMLKKVNKLVTNDRRLSVCFIAESVGISTDSMHSIVNQSINQNL